MDKYSSLFSASSLQMPWKRVGETLVFAGRMTERDAMEAYRSNPSFRRKNDRERKRVGETLIFVGRKTEKGSVKVNTSCVKRGSVKGKP
ncbi:hypothetical protein AMTRI_Chr05g73900 [Amborella trichopoda]